jgi:hypothetical protein
MDKPTIVLKRNKIQEVFDYCLDNKIAFTTKEREMGIDEYEIALEIQDVKKAILLGMFLRENRLELAGQGGQETKSSPKKAASKPVVSAREDKKPAEPVSNPLLSTAPIVLPTEPIVEPLTQEKSESASLSFDLN